MHVALINERTQQAGGDDGRDRRDARRRGGAACSAAIASTTSSAMLLAPCAAVHTAGMRFPIDVVFVDRQGYAVKVVRDLQPWRIAIATSGRAVIEMAAGSLRWGQVLLGRSPVSGAGLRREATAETPRRPLRPAAMAFTVDRASIAADADPPRGSSGGCAIPRAPRSSRRRSSRRCCCC